MAIIVSTLAYGNLTNEQLDTLHQKLKTEMRFETEEGRVEGIRWTTLFNIKQNVNAEITLRAKAQENKVIAELLGL